MTVPRNLRAEALASLRAQVVGAVCGSGEVWILHGSDGTLHPILSQPGLGRLPQAAPTVIALWRGEAAPLDLAGFLAGVLGRDEQRRICELDLERGFRLLAGTERATTLVVDAAERLVPEALHFIQFACITAPRLQVVFIAGQCWRKRLDRFPVLRARLQPDLVLADVPADPAPMSGTALHGPSFVLNIERAEQQLGAHALRRLFAGPHGTPGGDAAQTAALGS